MPMGSPGSCIRKDEPKRAQKLFVRGKRRLQLTEAGRLLYRSAQRILDLAEKTRHDVMSLENGVSGTINIAIVEGRALFFPPLVHTPSEAFSGPGREAS